jgi:hypothetical protein
LARITAAAKPDLVIVKTMEQVRRGRDQQVVTDLIETTLRADGLPKDRIRCAPSEIQAARDALTWAQEGDLLLLLCHAERDEVLSLLETLRAQAWRAGGELPPTLESIPVL